MAKGKGLGRGLEAIFAEEVPAHNTPVGIRLSEIEPNPRQPRQDFEPVALEELAQSIRENGVITPITLRKTGDTYQIIAGERRWRASRLAGLTEIPAIVLDVDENAAYALALIENLQREDLNPMEEAAGYQTLIEQYHMTQEEAAKRVGKSRSAVTNAIRLLSLCPPLRMMVEEGKLSAGHARALLPLSPALQVKAAAAVLSGGLSVRQTEALAKKLSAEKKPLKEADSNQVDYAAEAQKSLSSKLGRGVKIVSGRKKGRIELEYYGMDDLNDLLDALALLQIRKQND